MENKTYLPLNFEKGSPMAIILVLGQALNLRTHLQQISAKCGSFHHSRAVCDDERWIKKPSLHNGDKDGEFQACLTNLQLMPT